MTLEHQAAFARRIQRDKGYVTRLKQAGRLVMSGRLVDVEASIARIQATRGDRFDVSARAEAARNAKPAEQAANDADLGIVPPRPAPAGRPRAAFVPRWKKW